MHSTKRIELGILMLLLTGGAIWYVASFDVTERTSLNGPENKAISTQTLEVVSQNPDVAKVVLVSRALLSRPGFIAIRAIEGDRLGQIIEISPYLSVGEHTNIRIPLGDFYDGGATLIAVLYEDTGADKIFNDLDQVALDNEQNATARYVATGAVVPPHLFVAATARPEGHTMGGTATVRHTKAGFVPKQLVVAEGTTVTFVNETGGPMWVASNEHPAHTGLPTFDQFANGDSYTYRFDKKGVWSYHDHINPADGGVVTVR